MAQTKNVNMTPNDTLPRLHLSQYDVGRELAFKLCDGALSYTVPTGSTVKLMGTKPSGFGFTENCTVSGNTASISTTAGMTDEWGAVACELVVEKSGVRLGSTNLLLVVEKSPHPEGTTDGSQETVIPTLTLLVERVEAAASSILDMTVEAETLSAGSDATYSYDEETNTATFGIPRGADGSLASGVLAPTYSTSGTYAVGDYVYYSGNLYRCTTAITTAESWTSGHWTQVALAPEVTDLKADINAIARVGYYSIIVTTNGSFTSGSLTTGVANRIRTDLIPIKIGDVVKISNGALQHACGIWQGSVSSSTIIRNDNSFIDLDETITATVDGYLVVVLRKSDNSSLSPSDFDGTIKYYPPIMNMLSDIAPFFETSEIVFTSGIFYNVNDHKIDVDADYSCVKINVSPFRGTNIKGQTSIAPNSRYGIGFVDENDGFIAGHKSSHTGYYDYAYDLTVPDNATYCYISCRNATRNQWHDPEYDWNQLLLQICKIIPSYKTIEEDDVDSNVLSARHVLSGATPPLTLLHFSDLHSDKGALSRIWQYALESGSTINDVICTGDMVAGEAEQIESWWNENILTCIGNHDTCSYSGGVYDWTALSMSDRDAYYIAPFESNWGITHTSGTSYYYKDYATQKVRLIVMDSMLYLDNGADATTQTAWLASLLSDAITNNLHVIIGIHTPHGGASAKECSFSRYNQGIMPTLGDGNTPQSVVDTVANAIANGLHFIGYIVGHTHQDNIWDAEGDGTQLMYCVACAVVSQNAQWLNSDLHRDEQHDAFNILTIDTSRTLVKIIRGGGANIDDHMRTRKAICFNYSTGEMVGEVL